MMQKFIVGIITITARRINKARRKEALTALSGPFGKCSRRNTVVEKLYPLEQEQLYYI